ncbi:hypothetical protein LXL04_037312 [Taraxacum kok-saghyz]
MSSDVSRTGGQVERDIEQLLFTVNESTVNWCIIVRSIVEELKQVITASSARRNERGERVKAEDFDAEEGEMLKEENELEEELFDQVGDCLGTLLKTFKAPFLPLFDELLPFLMPNIIILFYHWYRKLAMIQPQMSARLRFMVLEYVPSLVELHSDHLLLGSKMKDHRMKGANYNVVAYDNAVSAHGKICQFHRDSINAAQIVPAWLNCLPLKGDLIEEKVVHDQLCSMVERSDGELLGLNHQYLPKIVSVFADVLSAVAVYGALQSVLSA